MSHFCVYYTNYERLVDFFLTNGTFFEMNCIFLSDESKIWQKDDVQKREAAIAFVIFCQIITYWKAIFCKSMGLLCKIVQLNLCNSDDF